MQSYLSVSFLFSELVLYVLETRHQLPLARTLRRKGKPAPESCQWPGA
jgi:hypothetical protein